MNKKIILTITIVLALICLIATKTLATEIVIGNTPSNNTSTNSSTNTNSSNTGTTNNTNKVNTSSNTANKVNTTAKTNTTNSSYKNTNLPSTGSEDFMVGFLIVIGVISAIYAYIKIKTYNI